MTRIARGSLTTIYRAGYAGECPGSLLSDHDKWLYANGQADAAADWFGAGDAA